jgi:transforming growth factor-beta-induced protein
VKKLLTFFLVVLMLFMTTVSVFAVEPEKDIVDTAIAAEGFDTLVAAVVAAGLVDALKGDGPFTVFAPTDEAFAALPAGVLEKLLDNPDILAKVLLYHVVAGQVLAETVITLNGVEVTTLQGQKVTVTVGDDVLVNDAKVVATDILCTNGVIHVIDKVLIPEWDIVETAILNDDFNTLVAALKAADLVGALKGAGPFTVFAPTDAAFAALPDGVLAGLLEDKDALTKVLLYHVLSGKVMASTVLGLDGADVETLLGQDVTVTIEGGKVFINDAEVIVTDVEATNGVIHVLDAVLVPDLTADNDVELPRTGGSAIMLMGLLAAGAGLSILKRRK